MERALLAVEGAFSDAFSANNASINTIANDPGKYLGRCHPRKPPSRTPGGIPLQEDSDAYECEGTL